MEGAPAQFIRKTIAMNDLSTVLVNFGNSPGFSWYPQLFQNYRVTGLKMKFTPLINTREAADPLVTLAPETLLAFINAGDGLAINPQANSVPEQRWCKYKPLNNWLAGGATKSVSLYMSTMKLAGGDRTVANSVNYTGECSAITPYYTQPDTVLNCEYGVCALKGSNLSYANGDKICDYLITLTYYVTFWGRRPLVN